MATASLKSALPEGTILSQDADRDFDAHNDGRTVTQRYLILRVQCDGTGSDTVKSGRVRKARYTAVQAVEITDAHKVDQLDHMLAEGRVNRGYGSPEQGVLWDPSEIEAERKSLLQALREWAEEEGVDEDTLAEKWNSFHGGNYDARLDHGAPAHLREFAIGIGALADTDPDGQVVKAAVAGDDEAAASPPFSDDDGDAA